MIRRPALTLAALMLAAGAATLSAARAPDVELSTRAPAAVHSQSSPPDTTQPPTTTTTLPPTTTTTAPPPTTTTLPPVELAEPQAIERAGACGGWESTILAHFPAEQLAKACAVMGCETGYTFDPGIPNEQGSGASGLWQFMPSTWEHYSGLPAPASAYSPDVQTAAAAALWRADGWRQWSCA